MIDEVLTRCGDFGGRIVMSFDISDYLEDYEGALRGMLGFGKISISSIGAVDVCVGFYVSNQQIAEFINSDLCHNKYSAYIGNLGS